MEIVNENHIGVFHISGNRFDPSLEFYSYIATAFMGTYQSRSSNLDFTIMDSLVPLIGHEAFSKNAAFVTRLQFIVEEELGHELRLVDAGRILDFVRAKPLRTVVPFAIAVKGVNPALKTDLSDTLRKIFPSSFLVEGSLESLPELLKQRSTALSLGHLNGAPIELRKAVKVIYKRMDDEELSVLSIANEIGVSKSTLERLTHSTLSLGAGHVIYRLRMEEAHRLTIESLIPVNAIGFAVGYSNLSSFGRAFLRFWGQSATVVRQNAESVSQNAQSMSQMANMLTQKDNKLNQYAK